MSFTYKVTARNIFRYKQRMLMTIFGVAGCTALLISGFGLRDSMSGIVTRQYQDIIHFDMIALQKANISASQTQSIQEQINQDANVAATFTLQIEDVEGYKDTSKKELLDIQVMASDASDEFSKFITLFDNNTKQPLKLPKNGVIITQKMAEFMNVSVGDNIKLYDTNNVEYTAKVEGIAEMYVGNYVFMSNVQYEKTFNTSYSKNAHLVQVKDSKDTSQVAKNSMSIDNIQAVQQSNQIINSIQTILNGLDKVISVLILCAIMLATIVIFNLTNINVAERIRELSTIKVLGFYPKEVTLYIYRETIILSILGIIVGYFTGSILHRVMILSLPPDNVMFYPNLLLSNIIISASITLAITLIIMGIMHRKLKRVNMLDALKSVD